MSDTATATETLRDEWRGEYGFRSGAQLEGYRLTVWGFDWYRGGNSGGLITRHRKLNDAQRADAARILRARLNLDESPYIPGTPYSRCEMMHDLLLII